MSLSRGYNEISKSDNVKPMLIPSPYKTTVFKPKELGQKTKGLSMRSTSDMNIHSPCPTSVKENTYNSKELKISKPKIIKPDSSEHQTCSSKEQRKYSNCEYPISEIEGLTLKGEKREINKDRKKEEVLDDTPFKKQLSSENFVNQIHEPENLAYFYDAQHNFDYEYAENMEQGLMDQLFKGKENVILCEEEDPQILLPVEIPKLILSSSLDDEFIGLSSPELLYISDNDDWSTEHYSTRRVVFERNPSNRVIKEENREINKDRKKEEVLDDKIFKKPLLPEKFVKQIREPENLAYYYDAQHNFDYEYLEDMEQGFMDQLFKGKENVILCEEEDLQILLPVEIPKLILSSSLDEEFIELSSPEVSYISADDTL